MLSGSSLSRVLSDLNLQTNDFLFRVKLYLCNVYKQIRKSYNIKIRELFIIQELQQKYLKLENCKYPSSAVLC